MKKKDYTPFILKVVRVLFPIGERLVPTLAHRFFVKLFFSPLHYTPPEKEVKAARFAIPFTLHAKGKRVQGYEWGEGDRCIFVVHGWAGRATQFRRFIKPFNKAGFKVIGFDGPAHGQSEGKSTNLAEFEDCLRQLEGRYGTPEAIIAHSFGGGAVLSAVMHGLGVSKVINIATPTIGDDIIDTYLKAIGGSQKTGEFFKSYVLQEFGKPFDQFTCSYFVQHFPKPIDLLLVHDDNDKEVGAHQAKALLELYPRASLVRTRGLGHTRILKDDAVIRNCVTFVAGAPSLG